MNKGKIILILVAAIAWGMAIHRYVSPSSDPEAPVLEASPVVNTPQKTLNKDSFVLTVLERDPFLGKTTHSSKTQLGPANSRSNHKTQKTKPKEQPVTWPSVSYHGTITNHSREKILGLVKVNGKKLIVGRGDTLSGGLLVINMSTSALEMKNANEIKTFQKTHQ